MLAGYFAETRIGFFNDDEQLAANSVYPGRVALYVCISIKQIKAACPLISETATQAIVFAFILVDILALLPSAIFYSYTAAFVLIRHAAYLIKPYCGRLRFNPEVFQSSANTSCWLAYTKKEECIGNLSSSLTFSSSQCGCCACTTFEENKRIINNVFRYFIYRMSRLKRVNLNILTMPS